MKRQFLIQQVLSILDVTPYKLGKDTYLSRSTISRWVRGAAIMDNGSLYQLNYYLKGNKMISDMLKKEIREIEGNTEDFTISKSSRIKGTRLTLDLCNEK